MKLSIHIFLIMTFNWGYSQIGLDTTRINHDVDSLLAIVNQGIESDSLTISLLAALSAVEIVESKLGKESERFPKVNISLGKIHELMDSVEKAQFFYFRALDAANEFNRSKDIYEECLRSLGYYYWRKGDTEITENYLIQEKNSLIEKNKQNTRLYADLHDVFREFYQLQGNYEDAEKACLENIKTLKLILDENSDDYLKSLHFLYLLYNANRKFEDAINIINEILSIYERTKKAHDNTYCQMLFYLSYQYHLRGSYNEAINSYKKTIQETIEVFSEDHDFVYQIQKSLAVLYLEIGEIDQAITYFKESLKNYDKNNQSNIPYFDGLDGLAFAYSKKGMYYEAEHIYLELLDKCLGLTGKCDKMYIRVKANLSNLYGALLNPEKQLSGLLECKQLLSEIKNDQYDDKYDISDLNYGVLSNLAIAEYWLSDYTKAIEYQNQAIIIAENRYGTNNISNAIALMNLANIYLAIQNLHLADSIMSKALMILNNTVGKNNIHYANAIGQFAILKIYQLKNEDAYNYISEANSIYSKVTGKQSEEFLGTLHSLIFIKLVSGKIDSIYENIVELDNLQKNLVLRSANFLDERELYSLVESVSSKTSIFYALNSIDSIEKNKIGGLLYNNALFYKGLVLNSFIRLKMLAKSDLNTYNKMDSLQNLNQKLAFEYSIPDSSPQSIIDTENKISMLEKELARDVSGFNHILEIKEWKEIQQNLNKNEAAIEFVKFEIPDSTLLLQGDKTIYGAIVLKKYSTPKFIQLFKEEELTELIGDYSQIGLRNINELYFQKGEKLFNIIWKPILPYLQDITSISYSPIGILNRVNLGALPTSDNQNLSEKWSLKQYNTTYSIASTFNSIGRYRMNMDALILGDIEYDLEAPFVLNDNNKIVPESILRTLDEIVIDSIARTTNWKELPETLVEVGEIDQILKKKSFNSIVRKRKEAVEELFNDFRELNSISPRIIHFATHAFFLDQSIKKTNSQFLINNFGRQGVNFNQNPLMQSGLILAGGNYKWRTGDNLSGGTDGILTAYEISNLNLSNTELVVLSACETGLGKIMGYEGVYGLQRAFKMAGVKYILMSLWKVNDKATREFMIEFYRQWLDEHNEIPEAYLKAQSYMRKLYPNTPYLWAPFVLIE